VEETKRDTMEQIQEWVHALYWEQDVNCATAMLICLGRLFDVQYSVQVIHAAAGLHGAGGFRAQCGLVEGALMFIGIYFAKKRKSNDEIVSLCYQFADEFTKKFHSLRCRELRPGGFVKTICRICARILLVGQWNSPTNL